MSETYIKTAYKLDWLLEQVENELLNCQDGVIINFSFIKKINGVRLPTKDEMLAVFEALSSLKILIREKSKYQLNFPNLVQKLEYCRGVRDTIINLNSQERGTVKLCAALPVTLDEQVEKALRHNTVDMRSSIVDIIGSSTNWVALVSPFWDATTAREIAEVLDRRLKAGVRVDILGRFENDFEALKILREKIGIHELCQFFAWAQKDSKDRFGKETFHFKAVVCDEGSRAYLGTANLNEAGLRSRMELGVILEGQTAIQLAQIVKIALSISRQI